MEDNRFKLEGSVTLIEEIKHLTQYLRKRTFKIRFSDTDFAGKIQERIIKFDTINAGTMLLDNVCVDDLVKVEFYIEGRDYTKENGVVLNFTSLIAYNIEIITSSNRDTQEDKEAVKSELGRVYKLKEVSEEELARNMITPDPEPSTAKDKEDPFASPPITQKEFNDLPF